MSGQAVLLVGDVGLRVGEQLSADGFEVADAAVSGKARALLAAHAYDAVVLGDLGGHRDSLEVLEAIRAGRWADRNVPIVVASTRAAPEDLLRAFDLGADDFIAAPVGYLELRARVRALLRRCRPAADQLVQVGRVEIDLACRAVRAQGALVHLSRLEFELLAALAADPNRVFTKEELLRRVWGFRAIGRTRTLDSHACRLRRKLGGAIVTVWGVGYRLAG